MFSKIVTAVAVFSFSLVCVIACNNDTTAPSPQSVDFSQSVSVDGLDAEESDRNEIFDDADSQAKAAAIDTAMQVKHQIRVTASCSTTGSASFKYVETTSASPTAVLSYSAASTAAGYKSFSVTRAKFNTALLKTLDKTRRYAVYAKIPATPKTTTMPSVAAYYKLVTTLPSNPVAAKKLSAKGKAIGRPITTAVTDMGCPQ